MVSRALLTCASAALRLLKVVLVAINGVGFPAVLTGFCMGLSIGGTSCSSDFKFWALSQTLRLFSLLVAMVVATWLLLTGASHHLRLVAWSALMQWTLITSGSRGAVYGPCLDQEPKVLILVDAVLGVTSCVLWFVVFHDRLVVLERAALSDFGSWRSSRAMAANSVLFTVVFVWWRLELPHLLVGRVALLVSQPILLCLIIQPHLDLLRRSKQVASAALGCAPSSVAADAQQAASTAQLQFWAISSSTVSSILMAAAWLYKIRARDPTQQLKLLLDVLNLSTLVLDVVGNSFLALSLSGALSGAARASVANALASRRRQRRRAKASSAWRLKQHGKGQAAARGGEYQGPSEAEVAWDEKVSELAGRGVSLTELLRFYRKLGNELMPTFDPHWDTTGDVVRRAVIPYTAAHGCAASELMMQGQKTLPSKMVTHSWSNKFVDLLASLVADALDEPNFSFVAFCIIHDLDLLETWIEKRGTGSQTYWVCAFSVNQHLCTCGPECKCGMTKALNDTRPTLADGRSVPCELNKFDAMMRYLAAGSPDFEQIVAVDRPFALFGRAWCVAEIATAHEIGMLQKLKISSADNLLAKVDELRDLQIQDMESTRQEDKEEILRSIGDIDTFNETLQKLVLEEVVPQWATLDGGQRMNSVGVLIRWHLCSQRHGPEFWSPGTGDEKIYKTSTVSV